MSIPKRSIFERVRGCSEQTTGKPCVAWSRVSASTRCRKRPSIVDVLRAMHRHEEESLPAPGPAVASTSLASICGR